MVTEQVTFYIALWTIAIAVLAVTIAELEAWRDTQQDKRRDGR